MHSQLDMTGADAGSVRICAASSAARDGALREIEAARGQCSGADGGRYVLHCVRLCAVHGLPMPQWLGDEFARRHELVVSAHVGSWDEAFGRYWPKRTRLTAERRELAMRSQVHARVWALIKADPGRAINRLLFDEIGEARGFNMSGSVAERLYYEAIKQGALNISTWRRSQLAAAAESQLTAKSEGREIAAEAL